MGDLFSNLQLGFSVALGLQNLALGLLEEGATPAAWVNAWGSIAVGLAAATAGFVLAGLL